MNSITRPRAGLIGTLVADAGSPLEEMYDGSPISHAATPGVVSAGVGGWHHGPGATWRVTLRLHAAGELIITSGRIVAWDPLWLDETTPALEVPIPPGRYPVMLTIAGGQVLAYATLWVRQNRPVRWEIARFDEGEKPDHDVAAEDDEIPGYPVDTGIGCFADAEAAQVFARRVAADAEALCDDCDSSAKCGTS